MLIVRRAALQTFHVWEILKKKKVMLWISAAFNGLTKYQHWPFLTVFWIGSPILKMNRAAKNQKQQKSHNGVKDRKVGFWVVK